MSEPRFTDEITRPTKCPFCHGKIIDTLAKVLTVKTLWRCRECEETWTLASQAGSSAGSRSTFS